MLTLPSAHPFLMRLLTEDFHNRAPLTAPPEHAWPTIVEEALTQRIAPLLFHRLTQPLHRHVVAPHVLTHLTQHVARHAAWHLLLARELRTILSACEQRRVPCIPIRGPALASQVYGAGSIRQMDDLDLLVRHNDLSAVKDLFQELGYTRHEQRPGFLETFSYSLEFVHPHYGFLVEPHWTLAYPPFVGDTAMHPVWKRAKRQQGMGIDSWSLSDEDLVLHLCLHLHHKGQQAPLLWFYEIGAVIRRHAATLDWNIIIEQARRIGRADVVADVLTLMTNIFHSPIPDSVVRQLGERAQRSSFSSSNARHGLLPAQSSLIGREEFLLLCSLDGVSQRLRYLSALLFPSPLYMTRRYGTSTLVSLAGAYVARFFRIGVEGLRCTVAWLFTVVVARQH